MTAPVRAHPLRRLIALTGWTSIDQAFFTLSNLVVTLAVVRGGGTEALGRFTVAFAAYFLVVNCARALIAEPLLARAPRRDERLGEAASTTLTLLCGCAGAVVMGGAGLILSRAELVIMAVALPVTLLHDMLRYHAFRRQQPALAALLDGGWLLGSIAAWPVVVGYGSPAVAVACWSVGALLGIAVGWRALRPRFAAIRAAIDWWHRDASGRAKPFIVEAFILAVYLQAVVFVVVALVGDEGLGTLRAGEIYFAPVGMALTVFGLLAVPQLAHHPTLVTPRMAIAMSAGPAAIAAVVCVAIVVAEPLLRGLLYADMIDVPTAVLVPLACLGVVVAGSIGLVILAKVRDRGPDLVRSRLAASVVGLTLLPIGTIALGLPGAAWSTVVASAWFTADLAIRTMRDTRRSAPRTPG